jgi:predicted nucleic acid-binding protein
VIAYLDQFLAGREAAPIPAGAYSEAIALLSESGSSGGAIYDALIALAAREARVTLVSLDRRALSTYELCSVEVSLLDGP